MKTMFDTAHVGDTVVYCEETHGLRPAEDWRAAAKVTKVERGHSSTRVTVDNGDEIVSGIHHLSVLHCANITRGHLMLMTKEELQSRAAGMYGVVLLKSRYTKPAMVEEILRLQDR
jgi:hypothetical protein